MNVPKINPVLAVGGVAVVVVVGYLILRPSSEPSQNSELTYIGPGIPTVTAGDQGSADLGSYLPVLTMQSGIQQAAIDSQFKLAESSQIVEGILDMYATIAPMVNVQRGFTQDFGAELNYTDTGAKIKFTGGISPVAPQQDLVDQISYLTSVNTDNTNKLNLLNTELTTLKTDNELLTSNVADAQKRAESLQAQLTSANSELNRIKGVLNQAKYYAGQVKGSDIDRQKTPGSGTKSLFRSSADALWNVLMGV